MNRRTILLASAILPLGWIKPVVDTVILPVHAICSPLSIEISHSFGEVSATMKINIVGNTLMITDRENTGVFEFVFPPVPFAVGDHLAGPVSNSGYSETLDIQITSSYILLISVSRTDPAGATITFNIAGDLCGSSIG